MFLPFFLYSFVVLCLDANVNLTFLSFKTELSLINHHQSSSSAYYTTMNKLLTITLTSSVNLSNLLPALMLAIHLLLLKILDLMRCQDYTQLYF